MRTELLKYVNKSVVVSCFVERRGTTINRYMSNSPPKPSKKILLKNIKLPDGSLCEHIWIDAQTNPYIYKHIGKQIKIKANVVVYTKGYFNRLLCNEDNRTKDLTFSNIKLLS